MIKLLHLTNTHHVKSALLKDDIYKGIFNVDSWFDGLIDLKATYVLAFNDKDKPVGLMTLMLETPDSVSFHGGVYKEYRDNTTKITKETLKIVQETLKGKTFWTRVTSDNKKCINLVKKLGCKRTGEIKNAKGKHSLYFYTWTK